jgi:ABC-2 type transport system ATP-binding protein
MQHEPAISADSLAKTYTEGVFRRGQVHALRGVSFQVERGEIFGLLGENGAGKTTFIKILLGIIRKSAGAATVLDHTAGTIAARRHIGYLPEHLQIPRYQTPYTALEFYGKLSGVSGREIKAHRDELIELVGLKGWEKAPIKKFSKGMKQRLGLAQALLHKPAMLILDEPTDGVDPVGRAQIRSILKQLREGGTTVFLNSHILQEVELICDRVAILHKGRLMFVGNAGEISTGRAQEVVLEVAGDQAAIRRGLGAQQALDWSAGSNQTQRLTLNLEEQPQVDQVVDSLRAAGVSIVALNRRRESLEDAFLHVVSQAPASEAEYAEVLE